MLHLTLVTVNSHMLLENKNKIGKERILIASFHFSVAYKHIQELSGNIELVENVFSASLFSLALLIVNQVITI